MIERLHRAFSRAWHFLDRIMPALVVVVVALALMAAGYMLNEAHKARERDEEIVQALCARTNELSTGFVRFWDEVALFFRRPDRSPEADERIQQFRDVLVIRFPTVECDPLDEFLDTFG